jgi:hypothetical protein
MTPRDEVEWSALAPFAGSGAIGSPGGTHPIAAAGDVLHAVYAQGGLIYYRRSTDGAKTWGDAVPLVASGTAQYPCSLEMSGSVLHLIWPDSRDGTWEVYHKRSTDGGNTWGPDTRLTHGVHLFRLGTALSGSTVQVVWGSNALVVPTPGGTHTWGEIYYKRSLDGGLTWEPDTRLTAPDASAMRPAVAASGDFVHVTWFDRRDAKQDWDWEIYYKRSTDGGATWGPDVRMTRTPTHTRHPEIVTTPGDVVCCIWEDGQVFEGTRWEGDPALYAAVSTDNGQTWRAPRRITMANASHGFATHPKVAVSGKRVHLAWTDSPEGPEAAYYMTSPDGGVTWGEPERLTFAADGSCPAEAVGGSDSCAVVLIRRLDTLCYRRRDIR